MTKQLELLVTEGPLKGRRFAVPDEGLRLGRSSSCEISIPDPALSRNHCLLEARDGGLCGVSSAILGCTYPAFLSGNLRMEGNSRSPAYQQGV